MLDRPRMPDVISTVLSAAMWTLPASLPSPWRSIVPCSTVIRISPGLPPNRSTVVPRIAIRALVPRIFFLRSASKPLMTDSTTVSAQTPTATPAMEMAVITSVAGRLRRCPGARWASCARACTQRPMSSSAATTAATEIANASASVRIAATRFGGPTSPTRPRATWSQARVHTPAAKSRPGGTSPSATSSATVRRFSRKCVRAMPASKAKRRSGLDEAPSSTPNEAPHNPRSQAPAPVNAAQTSSSRVSAKNLS